MILESCNAVIMCDWGDEDGGSDKSLVVKQKEEARRRKTRWCGLSGISERSESEREACLQGWPHPEPFAINFVYSGIEPSNADA